MKKLRVLLPLLALVFAVSIAWTTRPNRVLSDLVWFEVDANGDAVNTSAGIRGEVSPFSCDDGPVFCARALSISQGEVTLNTGSTMLYHINSGVDIQNDYDGEESKH